MSRIPQLISGALLLALVAGCTLSGTVKVEGDDEVSCGEGTHLEGSTCVADAADTGADSGADSAGDTGADDDCDGRASGCGIASGDPSMAEVVLTGPAQTQAYFGSGLAFADLNGDADPDLVVGAENVLTGSAHAGAAYLYTTDETDTLSTADAAYALVPGSSDSYDESLFGGVTVAVGDLESDGYEDVVFGARWFSNKAGGAWLYEGSDSPSSLSQVLTGSDRGDLCGQAVGGGADLTGDGSDDYAVACGLSGTPVLVYDRISATVAVAITDNDGDLGHGIGVGDVTGDGAADLILGRANSGTAYLLDGPLTASADLTDLVDDSASAGEYHGYEVSVVGDVTDDGYNDFVIGAQIKGVALLYPGGTGALLSGFHYLTSDVYSISIASGDLNSDGISDVVIGDASKSSSSGIAYVFYGPIETSSDFHASAAGVTTITGSAGDEFGFAVAVGDYDADGDDDLAVGGPLNDAVATDAGAVWVFLGGGL